MPTVVIVGAGVSGLAVAYRLQQRLPAATLVVLEAAARPGGTTWTLREQDFHVETGPNGFLDTKPTTLALAHAAGLETQLIRASAAAARHRFLFLGDRLRMLPNSLGSFLRTDLFGWRGKLSLLFEPFRRQLQDRADETILDFARRRFGTELADLLADTLVTGIYAGDPARLSLPACFPRIAALEREYGSILRGTMRSARQRRAEARAKGVPYERPGTMWSLVGGLRTLVEALTARLKSPPLFGVAVRSLSKEGEPNRPTWLVQAEGRDAWRADAVVLTCPAYRQAEMLADLDAELAGHIAAIVYNRVAVVALGYRRADVPGTLDGFGFIAPQQTRRDVLGVQWCSSIFPGHRAPDDAVLLRALCGGWQRPEMVDWDDDRLLAAVRGEVRQAMGVAAEPIFHRIIRWPRAIPQYQVGHLERVRSIEARLSLHPGLWLGGNAYHGVALNDCAEQGAALADSIASRLG